MSLGLVACLLCLLQISNSPVAILNLHQDSNMTWLVFHSHRHGRCVFTLGLLIEDLGVTNLHLIDSRLSFSWDTPKNSTNAGHHGCKAKHAKSFHIHNSHKCRNFRKQCRTCQNVSTKAERLPNSARTLLLLASWFSNFNTILPPRHGIHVLQFPEGSKHHPETKV